MSLGNDINQTINTARSVLFTQGELLQLTFSAFANYVEFITNHEDQEFTINYPVGYRPDRTTIPGQRTYSKNDLIERYNFLQFTQLGLNGVLHLTTVVEAMFGDVLRAVVMKYPKKLGAKRSIPAHAVLSSSSIEEVHLKAADSLISELLYKSPEEFAQAFLELTSLNLMECAAYQKYVEVKATRDIHVHNRGYVNELYLKKSGSHARAQLNHYLPIDNIYFLESYETCLQVTEWLEREMHEIWHSGAYESRQQPQLELPAPVGEPSAA